MGDLADRIGDGWMAFVETVAIIALLGVWAVLIVPSALVNLVLDKALGATSHE
jgi:hypothetical protein